VAAGLDPSLPTAWLAEGLLYYLEPSCVGAMLQVSSFCFVNNEQHGPEAMSFAILGIVGT
jgi:O-methyltransferase involved in polyketide biosynthesis